MLCLPAYTHRLECIEQMSRQQPAKKKGKTKKTMYSSFESEGIYVQICSVFGIIRKTILCMRLLFGCLVYMYIHSVAS